MTHLRVQQLPSINLTLQNTKEEIENIYPKQKDRKILEVIPLITCETVNKDSLNPLN